MTELHPQVLERDGKPSFVVLPYEEYVALREELEDLRDSRAIRDAAKRDKGTRKLSIAEVRANLRSRRKRPDAA
jgi:PHD/YefM family antitoxin component YafN of YafNO toxin-antitoxin module